MTFWRHVPPKWWPIYGAFVLAGWALGAWLWVIFIKWAVAL